MTKLAPEWVRRRPSDQKPSTLPLDYGARRVRFRARTELCAWKEDFGSGENRSVCAEDGYSLDDNICV